MKKLLFILFTLCVLVASAQRVREIAADTLNGAETVTFGPMFSTGSEKTLSVDVDLTEIGGTSDGTLILQARNGSDASWSTLTSTDFGNWINFMTNDTLTITDGGVWKVEIHDPGFWEYRISGTGTAGDSTLVEVRWLLKK